MLLDKAELEALKQANPIEAVAQALGLAVVAHKIRCPRPDRHTHGDRTASVTLWPDRGTFKCWVCPDVKGDVIDLVRLIQGCSFGEAVQWLKRQAGMMASDRPGVHAFPARPAAKPPPNSFPPGATRAPAKAIPEQSPVPKEKNRTPGMPFDKSADSPGLPIASETPVVTKDNPDERKDVLRGLLDLSAPISGPAAKYLQSRRIFKRTWDKQGLRWIDDYGRISRALVDRFGVEVLARVGLFNADGHLRYYRHVLLFPYFDKENQPVYLQARALLATVSPKELSLSGGIPLPYNAPLLQTSARHVYLCEGVIDTLTLLEQGFPALGIPGAANFKPAWVPLFHDKSVFIFFDPDPAGEAGAHRVEALLGEAGIAAHRMRLPAGQDINDWLRKGGLAPLP